MEELDDQLQNVVSRQSDVRRREHAWKAGPLLLAMNSPAQGHTQGSMPSTTTPAAQDYVQAEVRARSMGALSEGRMRQQSRERSADIQRVSEAQDRAIVNRGREIGARIDAAQRIASRD